MRIGLMGFDFMSPNKGCEALTYSFINMLIECFGNDLIIKNYTYGELGLIPEKYPRLTFDTRRPKVKSPIDLAKMKEEMSQMDLIFDVTFGDGFSDIYGTKWNIATNLAKEMAIKSGSPFILLPQTYGPYKSFFLKKWAEHIIKGSTICYSRDTASAKEMNLRTNGKVTVLTDMAFALPYDKSMYCVDKEKINVGINISSLLWDSGYARDNKFGLITDYKTYIISIIDYLLDKGNYNVHLIPHVVDLRDYESAENDVRACDAVKNKYPKNKNVIVAPSFATPVEAKSYISNMDIFLGARMHATIGAVSSGVATIPFAYSKKFKTMFGNIDYQYVIEAMEISTDDALKQTIEWIKEYSKLTSEAKVASISAVEKTAILKEKILEVAKNNEK